MRFTLLIFLSIWLGCSQCPNPFVFDKYTVNEGDRIGIYIDGKEHYSNEHEAWFDPGDEFGTLCDPYCPEGPFEIRIQLNTFDSTIQVDPRVIEGLVLGIDPQQEPIIIYDSTRPGLLFHKGEPCCFE